MAVLDVPRDGRWRDYPLAVEVVDVPSDRSSTLRIAFDMLDPGTVCIDDVVRHERFTPRVDREALRSTAFLAMRGLQRGDLTGAVRLLSMPAADELLWDYPPRNPERVPVDLSRRNNSDPDVPPGRAATGPSPRTPTPGGRAAGADNSDPPQPDETGPAASVTRRLRGWLPKALRF